MAERKKEEGNFFSVKPSRREILSFTALGLGTVALGACPPQKGAPELSSSGALVVRPKEIDSVLNNPWMGWGLWAGPIYFDGTRRSLEDNTTGFGDSAALFDWVLLDWMWADLEPREGEFQWSELDHVISYWAGKGKQINLRVWVTDDPGWNGAPGAEKVCPDWVYDSGLRWHDYPGEGGVKKQEPDYADPSFEQVFLPRLKNFLEALAARYDKPGHPFNFLSCMGYGQWGEWHTMWSKYIWPSKQVKHEILARIVNLYADTFRHTDMAISYCFDTFNFGALEGDIKTEAGSTIDRRYRLAWDDPEDFKYRQALDVALARSFLLERHGFIDGLRYTDRRIMEEEWLRRGLMAEGDWSYMDVKDHKTHGTLDENIDIMLEWHSNYGHFYMDAPACKRAMQEDAGRFASGLKSGGLGYRLVLTEASYPGALAPGQLFLLKQSWENRNVGRCYKRHPLKLYLTDNAGSEAYSEADTSFDQTRWIRGQTYELTSVFHLPRDLQEGIYDVRIAMTDRIGNPALSLGISGGDGLKRYRLGTVRIDKTVKRG
ncbi:MAG TPA: DUF4832 domain-containing protein [archaeon]|nr:DUF4832 domain-containing protein [archaeon]